MKSMFFALLAVFSVVAAVPTPVARATVDVYNIHPNGDTTKCVGVLGGAFVAGASIDIYDCNGSATQKWFSNEFAGGVRMINPADGSEWSFDVGFDTVVNGERVILNPFNTSGRDLTQNWIARGSGIEPAIRLNISPFTFVLDLTNGITTNQNPLQLWEFVEGNTNQIWTYTVVGSQTI
ncbi:ricin B lectin domain-containing protein [Mycena vulgaris]|nr:ricin B lectin domain-containing protein [Mycena vulgaris]